MKSVEIAAATLVRLSGLENENEERKVEKFSNGKMANRRRRQPTKCQNRMETSKYSSGQRCICAATIKLKKIPERLLRGSNTFTHSSQECPHTQSADK